MASEKVDNHDNEDKNKIKDKVLSSSNNKDDDDDDDGLTYVNGFGNELESSCLPGALPVGRNNPRNVPYGLYTEQLSGTAFTKPRHQNRRTWLYRIQPSVAAAAVGTAELVTDTSTTKSTPLYFGHTSPADCQPVVNALRWHPKPTTTTSTMIEKTTFLQGCHLMCHGGDVATKNGLAIYVYDFMAEMTNECMYNSDGEFLIVPQQGNLEIITEMGVLRIRPKEICVIPRGIVFSIHGWRRRQRQQPEENENDKDNGDDNQTASPCKGYVLEVYGGDGFTLPELGPIGSNGLANTRDFLVPTAHCAVMEVPNEYEQQQEPQQPCTIYIKMQSRLFVKQSNHSPYNVVAWHGNYLPYKYNLNRFCAANSVSYDHLDPSIYTVLTCPSGYMAGTALADFVLFPPRWMATDSNTLRPPWFHRNTMSEYMGLICGQYDAKPTGFRPGGASLHNCMTPHGPDVEAYTKAVADPCETPVYFDKGLAFMFETYLPLKVAPPCLKNEETESASSSSSWLDASYAQSSWQGLTAQNFTGWQALKEQQQKKKLLQHQQQE